MTRSHAPLAILIVEDEFLVAMELSSVLQGAGYDVIGPVPTVADALTMMDRHTPAACVLDVNLRGERSAPVARLLKERGVPFLISSATKQEDLERDEAFSGVLSIGKPAQPEQLLSQLAALLRMSIQTSRDL